MQPRVVSATGRAGDHDPVLSIRGLAKKFPNGTFALRSVDLTVMPGSVHGLIGANGAGKSTLIKIVSGAIARTAGEILWRGETVDWITPRQAMAAGVKTVYQNTPLVPSLSVIENVFLSERGIWWRDRAGLRDAFDNLARRVGYRIEPDRLMTDLSIGQRQMVAILQALAQGATLVIMDEPTAALSASERDLVFDTVRRLSHDQEMSFLYVSHLLDEVLELTDRVTVLRDGMVVLDDETRAVSEKALIDSIVGTRVETMRAGNAKSHLSLGAQNDPALEVVRLSSPGALEPVSFTVMRGEIVGIAGLLGSGRSELLHAIFRADKNAKGTVAVHGKRVSNSPVHGVSEGLALVPEDRDSQGLFREWEIWKNISLPGLRALSSIGLFPSEASESRRAKATMEQLRIKASSPSVAVGQLSGGNAQKVVFGKWISANAKVLLLDEPTAGVDIGAKADIMRMAREFASSGGAVVMVSSDFQELLSLADRVLIMRKGRIIGDVPASSSSEQELMALTSGVERKAASL